MPLLAAISRSLFEVNLSPGQPQNIALLPLGSLIISKNWCQPHFLVSNKIQNIKQHHLETKTRLIFDYALLIAAYCRPGITPWINNKFWSIISFYLFKSICLYFLRDKFHTYYLTSFSVGCCGKCLWLGFLNLCMAVTTDDNISNLVKEGIVTMHIGFLNFSSTVTSVWWQYFQFDIHLY